MKYHRPESPEHQTVAHDYVRPHSSEREPLTLRSALLIVIVGAAVAATLFPFFFL